MKKPKWMILVVIAFFGFIGGVWGWSYLFWEVDWPTWQELPIFVTGFLYFVLDVILGFYAYAKALGV